MKFIATFFATLTILTFYIAFVAGPLSHYLQKKNVLSHRITLLFLYVMMGVAVFLSLFNPEISLVSTLLREFGSTGLGAFIITIKRDFFEMLRSAVGTEATFYRLSLTTLVVMGIVGATLYLLSLIAILLRIKGLLVYRKLGRVILLKEKNNITPHVFSVFGKSYIVVPENIIKEKALLRTSIQHELQHIRNGDTQNIYLLHLLRCFMWINPAIHILFAQIRTLQELRVDESLIHEKRIGYKIYLQTLKWFVSKSVPQGHFSLSYSIFGWSTFRELKKRVHNIHRVRPVRTQPIFCAVLFVLNIFSLLFIANSSPRYNYSLYEVQRMFMPEYMKKEFKLHVENRNALRSTDAEKTIHKFGFTNSVEIAYSITTDKAYKVLEDKQKDKAGRLLFRRDDSNPAATMKFYYPISIKAIEYADDYVLVSVSGLFSDEDELNQIKDVRSKISPQKRGQTVKLVYNESVDIEDFDLTLKVVKELMPPTISYKKGDSEKLQWLADL